MSLGAFSISLTVKDLAASKAFYSKLWFSKIEGDETQNWVVLANGDCVVGLFQGMFDKNILTFNPGFGPDGTPLDDFEDVRDIQKRLKGDGVSFEKEADETTTGPASFVIVDPDGNPILVDQHV